MGDKTVGEVAGFYNVIKAMGKAPDIIAIRNYGIMREYKTGSTYNGKIADIAVDYDVTTETVRHAIRRIDFIESIGTFESYGNMLYDICAIILEHDDDPNKFLTITMTALWMAGITTKTKLKKMSADDFEALLAGKYMKRAGNSGRDALRYYRESLKASKKG